MQANAPVTSRNLRVVRSRPIDKWLFWPSEQLRRWGGAEGGRTKLSPSGRKVDAKLTRKALRGEFRCEPTLREEARTANELSIHRDFCLRCRVRSAVARR
ncbi:Hypothetical predicted protein [Olea europaea subsp. europaea]|uniref:Uncharacterized protein n=1 Tax=Olea europaea subsp. europaea TaxID=158383 RepID=A0A8S0TKL0_OLEEU|nr:Hypothetical predicted protein [Olea europaea subsp. europaea]